MKNVCLLIFGWLFAFAGMAQRYDYASDKEKIYIQTSHVFFTPGETAYFKIYVVAAQNQLPARASNVVYVELLNPAGSVVQTGNYRIENGYAEGSVTFDDAAAGGIYKIRSYTTWMRNEGEDLFFTKELVVQKVISPRILMKLDFPGKGFGPGAEVMADFSMRSLANQPIRNYAGKFTVSLAGNVVQTKEFRTDKEGKAQLKFFLPDNLTTTDGLLNVTISYDSYTESVSRSVPILLNKVDLQFMPEGGTLVAGIPSWIAFKAVNEHGKPADISGEIWDNENNKVASFESYHAGMGKFAFTPRQGVVYTARVTSPSGIRGAFSFPCAAATGVVMNFSKKDREILVKLTSTAERTVLLSGQTKGVVYFNRTIALQKGENTVTIEEGLFPAGIAQFTLSEQTGVPLAERLLFLNGHRMLQVSIGADKTNYLPREKVTLTVRTTDENGKPVPSNLSLAVLDDKLWTMADDKQDHILSWLLMSSELKGKIEEPQFYFKKEEPKAIPALDLVMLTHGYRYFDYTDYVQAEGKLKFIPDQGNVLSGKIVDSKGNPARATVYLMQAVANGQAVVAATTADGLFFFSQLVPNSRYYLFAAPETKKEKVAILILQNGMGYNMTRSVGLQTLSSPGDVPVIVDMNLSGPGVKAVAPAAVAGKPAGEINPPGNQLNEVVVIGYANLRKRDITGAATRIDAKEIIVPTNIDFVLQGKVPGLVINRAANPLERPAIRIRGMASLTGMNQPLFILNGVPMQAPDLRSLNPEDIQSITVLKDASAAALYGSAAAYGVIVIESDKMRYDKIRIPVGNRFSYASQVIQTSGPVCTIARRFYAPAYTTTDTEIRDDFRETIYWNPVVQTDRNGTAKIEFYNSDATTTFRAIAEGIGYNGKPGRTEMTYATQNALTVDVKIPPYLTAGDKARLPLVIKNNKPVPLTVSIRVELPAGMKAGHYDSLITLAPSGAVQVAIPVEATAAVAGSVRFTITSPLSKETLVLPVTASEKGFPVVTTFSGNRSATHAIAISKMVPGSLAASLKLYRNLEGHLLDGIESMLREPYGCFEQTSSATYPNIYILKYLRESGKSNPAIEKKALDYLQRGYARLTGFETANNGFEWFGHTPPHEALTAYGLLEFTDMKAFIKVNEAMLTRTKKFLLSRRDGKGGFLLASDGYDRFASVPNAIANIYIVYALTQAGIGSEIQREYAAAVKQALNTKDGYQLAMMAVAASNMKNQSDYRQLMNAVSAIYKNTQLPSQTSVVNSGGQSLRVETLSLYALALMREPSPSIGLVAEIISTILAQKSYYGYGSTQATVFALQAIVAYQQLIGAVLQESQMLFTINGKPVSEATEVSGALQEGNNTFSVQYSREDQAIPYNLEVAYSTFIPPNSDKAELELTTRLTATQVRTGETVRLQVDVHNKGGLQPMAIAKIGIPAGLAAQPWQLKELVEKNQAAYYEIFDNYLVFYWMGFAAGETKTINLDLKAEVPGLYKGKASTTYLYYTPEHKHWQEGLEVEVME
ncbi:MAG: TonB-dependent receptor plug domain-containing protein [Chitinophagaceae bacterium]